MGNKTGSAVNRWIAIVSVLLVVSLPALLQGCGQSGSNGDKVTLILGAYTTPREAYGKAILPAFRKYWKEKTGQDVEFQESYQASGAQARSIIGGFEADVAALSLAGDIDKIVEAGLITHDWKSKPHGGMVSTSIVVIAVRPGNPKGIKDWPDLTAHGLNILTPDPKTSGGAMWNINAMYGAALRGHAGVAKDDPAAAQEFLKSIFRNVSIMDKGARESITNYEKGVGDLAITYENEVLVGRQTGQKYEYVIPRSTILIENPVAIIDKNVDLHGTRQVAEAFVEFLFGREAQLAYARYGLRPVGTSVAEEVKAQYPPVEDLWKIDFLGGWDKVIRDIYGPQGVFTKMYEGLHAAR
ncbi:MAG TPA: sulfate ABC transporter substrate-binding protein [Blastocatellia bacterium]|nr:sulfate ABC transporter substrate-binding protein [Blastocatellia bacterium]